MITNQHGIFQNGDLYILYRSANTLNWAELFIAAYLRGNIFGSAYEAVAHFLVTRILQGGSAEVSQFQMAFGSHEDVLRLQVAYRYISTTEGLHIG